MTILDRLSLTSLEWAAAHIARFGDTDIFPVPFEFEAIKHSWTLIQNDLAAMNLAEYCTRPSRPILVPKSRTGYRVAVQLDPLDALVYAALVYESAEKIEKYRVPASKGIACSFRLQVTADGSLFEQQAGWPRYHERSVALSKSGKYTHVLTADIADFYNQISHHRVSNVLQSAGIIGDRTKNIEAFVSKLSAKQSRGLPVGPSASIVLAEASLDDVDKFLISRNLTSVRYVDDFRVFCRSEREGIEAAHDLTKYLYTAHRLALTPSKTKLYSVKKFIDSQLLDPAEQEERGKVSKLKLLIDEFLETTGYQIDFGDLDEPDLKKITRENLVDLFREAVKSNPLQLGLARYILRRAKQLGTSVLQKPALKDLTKLAPAMREVIEYLAATVRAKNAETVAKAILEHLTKSPVGRLPFVRLWGLEFFIRRPFPRLHAKAVKMAEDCHESLGIRLIALLAKVNKQIPWVRAQKETWGNHAPWDRRAVIWAASILPEDERRHWCRLVKETSPDLLDRAVAVLAAQG